MRSLRLGTATLCAAALLAAGGALAAPEGWHKSLEDGTKAAKRSGKPILVITTWRDEQ
ncbi:MAG: hypothetical protein ACYTE5_10415 [Planctomycetota bacterium]|jgi:hypothetical protein